MLRSCPLFSMASRNYIDPDVLFDALGPVEWQHFISMSPIVSLH